MRIRPSKISIKKILIFYVGLGPVFWLGPIEIGYFKALKFLILITLIVFVGLNGVVKKNLTHNNTFVAFVVLLFLTSIFGFLQSSIKSIISVSISYILIFIVSWIFYSYFRKKNQDDILEIFLKATRIVAYISGFIIINHFIQLVDWKYISEGTRSYSHLVKLADTGFSTGRTAWSNGLALYFIVAIYAFFILKKKQFLYYAIMIFTTQVLSGGRGGILISFLIITFYVFSRINFKWILIIILSISTLIITNQEYLKKRFRLNKLEKNDGDALNKFTAGRLGHFSFAFENIGDDFNYVKGNGFLKDENKIDDIDIHFLWLKKMLEGGVIFLSIYVLFIIVFMVRMVNLLRKDSKHLIFIHIFLGGLITTLFEPNAIFGSLQSSLLWWAALSAVESIRISDKTQLKKQKTII